ncbi:MAG: peptidase, partial [Campylobacterales bacterium]|nr:peptidase [Campylobacterales bacterium]
VSFIDRQSVGDITDFDHINQSTVIQTIGTTIPSEKLTQGIWSHWDFNEYERRLLEIQLQTHNALLLKISGPTKLPLGRDSQMMMFDLGYGNFGGGIHYRPNLFIKYTLPSQSLQIAASTLATISLDRTDTQQLSCGFDKENQKIYGYMEFSLETLPEPNQTVITGAYISIKSRGRPRSKEDIRYNVEFVDIEELSCENIKVRERIEFIGYEVRRADLQKNKWHHFIFDSYSRQSLEEMHRQGQTSKFIIKPTSAIVKNHLVTWDKDVTLTVEYIPRRKSPPPMATDLKVSNEGGKIKLTWTNPKEEEFVGVYVVRNRFHPPTNPSDGDKLYAGKDNYTYDT